MKLADYLVDVLPEIGGWPEGCHVCSQRDDGQLYFGVYGILSDDYPMWAIPEKKYMLDIIFKKPGVVTIAEYEMKLQNK